MSITPSIRITSPSPEPSLSRSWNYKQTSVGEQLDLMTAPVTPQRKRRRIKVEQLLTRYELIPFINLQTLYELGCDLDIHQSEEWINYIDAIIDFTDEFSNGPTRRLLENLSTSAERLVEQLDTSQLVRLRLHFTCIEREFENAGEISDTLEQYYLRGLEPKYQNYCSSATLRFGQHTTIYSSDAVLPANYFIDLKLYDLATSTILQPVDPRDAIVNVKFYGNQLNDSDPFRTVRQVATQCIKIIEHRK